MFLTIFWQRKERIKKKKENNEDFLSFSFSLTLKFNYEKINPIKPKNLTFFLPMREYLFILSKKGAKIIKKFLHQNDFLHFFK